MFKKFIVFDVYKNDVTYVIDYLSKYNRGVKVTNWGIGDKNIYTVSFSCKRRKFDACLSDIMSLNKNGVTIKELGTC